MTSDHSGMALGTTGGALSSWNLESFGRSPIFHMYRHLGSGFSGMCALFSSDWFAISATHFGSRAHFGNSTPSGVTPTW